MMARLGIVMEATDRKFTDYVIDDAAPDGIRPVPAGGADVPGGASGDLGVVDLADHTETEPVPSAAVDAGPSLAPTGVASGATPTSANRAPRLTRASAAWAAITAALLLAVVLIVFVLQNPTIVVLHFLGFTASVAVGMAMLIAAVTSALLVAAIGVARLTQLRVRDHRTRRQPAKP